MGSVFIGLCCLLLAVGGGESAPLLTANEHPWGHFSPNSWCIVQTAILSNFDGKAVQSRHTIKTTLQTIKNKSLTLEETETLEFGGKIVQKQPQVINTDFFQEPVQENVKVRQVPPVKLLIDKKVVPCFVRIYEHQHPERPSTTTVWYTPHVFPYVLRLERIVKSVPNSENVEGQIIRHTIAAVQTTSALKSQRSIRRNRLYSLQTVEKGGNITKVTDARCTWDVPGGLLESTTREFDAQNREIRRYTSRMTNYYIAEAAPPGVPLRYYRLGIPAEITD